MTFEADVLGVLQCLRPGDVVSYGEVAEEAGHPGAARAVGNILRDGDDLPWWRVVTAADGRVPRPRALATPRSPTARRRGR